MGAAGSKRNLAFGLLSNTIARFAHRVPLELPGISQHIGDRLFSSLLHYDIKAQATNPRCQETSRDQDG
jgi:hypothetical protein